MENVRNTKPGYALVISKYAFANTFTFAPSPSKNNTGRVNRAYKAFCIALNKEMKSTYGAKWLGVATCEFANATETFKEMFPYGDPPANDVYRAAVKSVAALLELQFKTN